MLLMVEIESVVFFLISPFLTDPMIKFTHDLNVYILFFSKMQTLHLYKCKSYYCFLSIT